MVAAKEFTASTWVIGGCLLVRVTLGIHPNDEEGGGWRREFHLLVHLLIFGLMYVRVLSAREKYRTITYI